MVGSVICAHSKISIRNERVKLVRCHFYPPVIKWVIIVDYLHQCQYHHHRCSCHRHQRHCHCNHNNHIRFHIICLCKCQCQCQCHIRYITIIITYHTYIVAFIGHNHHNSMCMTLRGSEEEEKRQLKKINKANTLSWNRRENKIHPETFHTHNRFYQFNLLLCMRACVCVSICRILNAFAFSTFIECNASMWLKVENWLFPFNLWYGLQIPYG